MTELPSRKQDRYTLASVTRAESDARRIIEIRADNFDQLLASARPRGTLTDLADRLLLLLASRSGEYWLPFTLSPATDWPLIGARGERELTYLFSHLVTRGDTSHLDADITATGWQRVESLRASRPQSPQAFVAMWFAPELNEAWSEGLKAGIEDTKRFSAIRVSDVPHNDKIDDRIVAEIRRSSLLVADFTGARGGVYFEAGFALGLGIPVIWTCRRDWSEKLHFDTRQYNHILWESPEDLRVQLKNRIEATILSDQRAAG